MGEETIDLLRLEQAELIEGLGPAPSTPFGLHVIAGVHRAAELARHLEREVFLEAFGNTPQQIAAEYREYDASSVFFVVVDHRRRVPAGAVRLILPSAAGLKTLVDLREAWGEDPSELMGRVAGVDPAIAKMWDIATLAVAPDYRKSAAEGVVSMALWQAIGVLSCRCLIEVFMAIIDVKVLELLVTHFPGVLEPFPGLEPKRYLDSPASVPVWGSPLDYADHLATSARDLYELVVEGKGLEPVVTQPDWTEATDLLDAVADRSRDRRRTIDQPIVSPASA